MDQELLFRSVMNRTKILRPPRHTLATFGTTVFDYVLVSPLPELENQCRLRTGRVTAQRPKILTPDLWKERFEGFDDEMDVYKGMMDQMFGEAFRALEYTFKNELKKTSLEPVSLSELTQRASQTMDRENAPRATLLQGPDAAWGLSVMKFIVEMSLRSFPVNLRELSEHDCFEPAKRVQTRNRHRVETLFKEAAVNSSAIKALGEVLRETGLFSEYEDRFFRMIKPGA